MKKVMMVFAVAACVLAVSACKNGSKAAEGETECTECTECCCDETKCAACDSCACNATDTVAVVETVAEEVKAE